MRLAAVLVLALALPACASFAPEGGSTTNKSGGDDFYSGSPTGIKEYGRKGGYGAVAAIQGIEEFDTGGTGLSADNSDVGFAIRGGWRTPEGLAVEGSIESVTGYTLSAGPSHIDLDFSSFSVSGKYYLAKEKVQPYALVGLGWAGVDTRVSGRDANDAFIRIGVGSDFYLTKDVALFAEVNYNRMTGDLKDLDHVDLVLGFLFRF